MTEKAGDIHAKELWRVQARIAKYRRDAEKLERFMSSFLMYPDGPEGTVVYRRSVEEDKTK